MTDGWKGLEDIENQKIESLGLSDDEIMIAQAFKGEKGAKAL